MSNQLPKHGSLREGFEALIKEYSVKERKLKIVIETPARNVDLNNLLDIQNCAIVVGVFEQQIPMGLGAEADEEDEQLDSFRQTADGYGTENNRAEAIEQRPNGVTAIDEMLQEMDAATIDPVDLDNISDHPEVFIGHVQTEAAKAHIQAEREVDAPVAIDNWRRRG